MGIQEYLPQTRNIFGLFHSADASQKKASQTQWIQFLFFSWDRNWQTMAHSLNLAHCLFLYSLEQKMDFTFLNIWRKKRIPFCNTWTLYFSWISVQAKLCDNTDVQVCSHRVLGCFRSIEQQHDHVATKSMLSTLEPFAGKVCRPLLWALNKNISKLIGKGLYLPFLCFPCTESQAGHSLKYFVSFNFLKECNLSNSYPLTYKLKQAFPFFLPTPHFIYNRNLLSFSY